MAESNEKQTNETKICPFTKEACMESKCALWTGAVTIGVAGGRKGVCVFHAILIGTISPPRQPTIPMPHDLGGLGIFKQ